MYTYIKHLLHTIHCVSLWGQEDDQGDRAHWVWAQVSAITGFEVCSVPLGIRVLWSILCPLSLLPHQSTWLVLQLWPHLSSGHPGSLLHDHSPSQGGSWGRARDLNRVPHSEWWIHPASGSHLPEFRAGLTCFSSYFSWITLLIVWIMTLRHPLLARIYITPNIIKHFLVSDFTPAVHSFIQQTLRLCLLCSSH